MAHLTLKKYLQLQIAFLIFGIGNWGTAAVPQKTTIELDRGTGKTEFRATGRPSALKIVGTGAAPRGEIRIEGQNVTGKIHVDLSSFDTGIQLRNQHMKEKYLETAKYPEAELTLTHVVLPEALQDNSSHQDIPFEGKLSLHGVERPIQGKVNIDKRGHEIKLVAKFDLKIKDYQIQIPGFAGVTMADDVQIAAESSSPLISDSMNPAKK